MSAAVRRAGRFARRLPRPGTAGALVLVSALALALAGGLVSSPARAQPASATWQANVAEWEQLHEAVRGYYVNGQTSQALQMARRMNDLAARAAPPLHPMQAVSAWKLGLLYHEQREPQRAEPLLRRALAIMDRMPAPDVSAQGSVVAALANLCAREGRVEEAEALYARAFALYAMPDEQSRSMQLRLQYEQAVMYSVMKDWPRAQALLERSLAGFEALPPGEQSFRMAQVLRLLGTVRRDRGDFDGALRYLNRALEAAERQTPMPTPFIGFVLTEIAVTQVAAGRPGAADETVQRALQMLDVPASTDNPSLSRTLHAKAQIQLAAGDAEGARKTATRALELKRQFVRGDALGLAQSTELLADIEDRRGNTGDAATLRTSAKAAMEADDARERDPIHTQASYVAAPPVEYPDAARRGGYEGKVLLRARVGADGIPAFVTVAGSSGYAVLDDAATTAVLRMQFTPARTRSGRAAPASVMVPIDYRLGSNGAANTTPGNAPGDPNNYAARIAAAVRPHVTFATDGIQGNPAAEFDVELMPDGYIIRVVLEKPSGYPAWDEAARRAILKTERLPFDMNGKVPPRLVMALRPFR